MLPQILDTFVDQSLRFFIILGCIKQFKESFSVIAGNHFSQNLRRNLIIKRIFQTTAGCSKDRSEINGLRYYSVAE